VTHIPCLFKIPSALKAAGVSTGTSVLSSHVDLLPTLLGLTGLSKTTLQNVLANTFAEAQPLVGKDLSPIITGKGTLPAGNDKIFVQIEDQIFTGTNQISPVTKRPYASVTQPASLHIVMAYIETSLYKYIRYFDNTQWWTNPGTPPGVSPPIPSWDLDAGAYKTAPVGDQYELYNVTGDPTETINLMHPANANSVTKSIAATMAQHLHTECVAKRLKPQHEGPPPGWMECL